MALTGEPKSVGRSFKHDGHVCAALQGSLTLEGLLRFYEARTWAGMLESVADHIGKATKAATFLIRSRETRRAGTGGLADADQC